MENEPEGFYTIFKNEKRDVTYLDKGFEEVVVNFMGIETTCLKYCSSFLSKLKLHKHVKADYVKEALPSSFA